ncbi:MAG: hypothetical protein IPP74_15855 [Alphaproteobacteria bacterium]|nr:hypothetical protein [Alphaproteobacteria bacterium]
MQRHFIEADSSFVWIPAETLQVANQIVAIAYGVLPTLASAILGWIQGGVDKLTIQNSGTLRLKGQSAPGTKGLTAGPVELPCGSRELLSLPAELPQIRG